MEGYSADSGFDVTMWWFGNVVVLDAVCIWIVAVEEVVYSYVHGRLCVLVCSPCERVQ